MLDTILSEARQRDPEQPEFHQAVSEVAESVLPVLDRHPEYRYARILERLIEPNRVIQFGVPWMDDEGNVQVNRGFRCEFNNAIGPYKGGLRFHSSVNLGIVKFLGFEQIFKSALTGLAMGGGSGGADFETKGRTDNEVMRFCQRFMTELFRHIGPDTDVPAGDIGVGGREIGFLFGQYRTLVNKSVGVLTGKGLDWGGSMMRTEAPGYGLVYFTEEMLKTRNESFLDKTVIVSGSGNVAIHAIEKAQQLGAKIIACSDTDGFVYDPEGVNLDTVRRIKEVERGRIKEYCGVHQSAEFNPHSTEIWNIPCDIALPSATENEIDARAAQSLVDNGVIAVGEGANMPSTAEATDIFIDSNVLYGPAKAANAGGVAVSGLEMCQNSQRMTWTSEEVDAKLHQIMVNIHKAAWDAAEVYGKKGDLVFGANIAGFVKVARSMQAQGVT